jgi:outer membrane protein OmpA-like peptidoglycan-associated protein
MKLSPMLKTVLGVAFAAQLAFAAQAQQGASVEGASVESLAQRLATLDADPALANYAPYERLQARQAVQALDEARSRDREAARYVAERRVRIAEVSAANQVMQRELDRLDRQRSDLLVEASRQDAARARAEAERLRIQAQIQAEEAERLRLQTQTDADAMQDIESALQGVAGVQQARLAAAREREAALARQEAELMAGSSLPPVRRDSRGEVFTLAGDAFASGRATLTPAADAGVSALATYLQAGGRNGTVRIEGHSDSQGDADANQVLSQRRAEAVRDALAAAGLPSSRLQAVGLGQARPVADNGTAAGRARNRRVEIIAK